MDQGLRDLPDPRSMHGMDAAVERVLRARDDGEAVCVHGDYDADGTTSTALLVDFLERIGCDVSWYAPHRERDGYGLQVHTVERLAGEGTRLIITCDNGVSAHGPIARALELGLDTVVVDHHALPDELPPAAAVLNPRLDGPPYEELAAVGVAFMLVVALRARLRERGEDALARIDVRRYLDLVALGTVADLAPLKQVNRLLVRAGLRRISARRRPGVAALLELCKVDPSEPVKASHLGFKLGPRINAAGRLDEAARSVHVLLETEPSSALEQAEELHAINQQRMQVQDEVVRDALRMAAEAGDFASRRGLVLWSERWHPGVVGIVASKLKNHFHRPAVVVAVRGEEGTGSGRSIHGVDLVGVLRGQAHLLERFGGHRAAAGLTIRTEQLPALREAFREAAFAGFDPELWTPRRRIDAEVDLADVSWDLLEELRSLAPFGVGSPEPVLLARDLRVTGLRTAGSDGLIMQLQSGRSRPLRAFGWALGVARADVPSRVDAVFTLEANWWRGEAKLQLSLKDLRPALR